MIEHPPINQKIGGSIEHQPERYNPDLAQIAIIQEIMRKSGQLTIVSKEHSVQVGYHKMLLSQFHIDTRLVLGVLEEIGVQSVHVNGRLFDEIMQFLQKVNLVVSGFGQSISPYGEEPLSIGQRFKRFFGMGKKEGET